MSPSAAEEPRAPFRQVAEAIRSEIRSGALAPGSLVPSIRVLAERYGVAKATAQKAVNLLRSEGLIYTTHGRGTYVRDELPEPEPEHSAEFVAISEQLRSLEGMVHDLSARLDRLEQLAKEHGAADLHHQPSKRGAAQSR